MTEEIKSALELALERAPESKPSQLKDFIGRKVPEMVSLPDAIKELRRELGIEIGSIDESKIPPDKRDVYVILATLEAVDAAYKRKLAREETMKRRGLGQYL